MGKQHITALQQETIQLTNASAINPKHLRMTVNEDSILKLNSIGTRIWLGASTFRIVVVVGVVVVVAPTATNATTQREVYKAAVMIIANRDATDSARPNIFPKS